MNEIGIRELKAKASELVRHVAEDHATYTITRRGRPVGVLAPTDYVPTARAGRNDEAWEGLEEMWQRFARSPRPSKSALQELFDMRRERDDALHGGC